MNGIPCFWEVKGSDSISLGLSKKFWIELAARVGRYVLSAFAEGFSAGVCTLLADAGIVLVVIGPILIALTWSSLLVYLYSRIEEDAHKIALADWYSYGYCFQVFPEYYPRNPDVPADDRGDTARVGMTDLISEVRSTLREAGQDQLADRGTDDDAIREFKAILIYQHNRNSDFAFEQFRRATRERALEAMNRR